MLKSSTDDKYDGHWKYKIFLIESNIEREKTI